MKVKQNNNNNNFFFPWDLSSLTCAPVGIELVPSALGAQSLTHWTTRNNVRSEVRIECKWTMEEMGFPGGAAVKNSPAKAGDATDVNTRSERFPGEGSGNLLQYSSLENSMDRGVWWATVHGIAEELDMTERLSTHTEEIAAQWNVDTATVEEELNEGTFIDTNEKRSSKKKLSQSDAGKETLRHMS